MPEPLVSVVIPAYNAARHLRGCLDGVLAQEYPACEVVVVDDASTDETRAVLREFPRVKVVEQPDNRGPGSARNRGVDASGGEVLVFLDSDCLVEDPGWLGRHVRVHRDLHDVVVGGGVVGTGTSVVARADNYCHWVTNIPFGPPRAWSATSALGPTRFSRHLVSTNMSVKRADFARIGPFDPTLRVGEDADFCERALGLGFTLRLEPSIVVCHRDRERLRDFFRCFYEGGKNYLPMKWRQSSRWQRVLPRGVASSFLFCLALGVVGPLQPLSAWWPHDRRVALYLPLISLSCVAKGLGIVSYWLDQKRGEA